MLTHEIFKSHDIHSNQYFDYDKPVTEHDYLVLELLDDLSYSYYGNKIEYWFQDLCAGKELRAHFDFNYEVDLVNITDKSLLMSPVTIVVYLEVSDDLVGGDLCISDVDWTTLDNPWISSDIFEETIDLSSFDRFSPKEGEVLMFEGSRYFHWIEKVERGTRKSLLINFWDEIDK